ncbi:MAG: helix-turn-helix domain-containing protein [Steroidobacteraceae bacterium]
MSLLIVVPGHRALKVGLIGREGMLGLSPGTGHHRFAGSRPGAENRGGRADEISAFCRNSGQPCAAASTFRFTDALILQVTQTPACNRFHTVEERLARWLLMTRERVPPSEFHLTQESLADMLSVRRAGVTAAAGTLQRRKLIRYRRGTITILDQQGLEAAT